MTTTQEMLESAMLAEAVYLDLTVLPDFPISGSQLVDKLLSEDLLTTAEAESIAARYDLVAFRSGPGDFQAAVFRLTGCRGIKSEVVESERTIDREYTIGYSANLAYGVVETETFAAYVTRKKNLLRDRLRGGPGILIYEESPSASKRRRSGKRGLEDLADSAINVAGSVTGGR